MTEQRDPPPNRGSLVDRIRNAAQEDARHGDPNVRNARLALAVANIVVGRLLPSGVVKGGTSMQIRFGANARYTRDLDAARPAGTEVDKYIDALADTGVCQLLGRDPFRGDHTTLVAKPRHALKASALV